MGPKTVQIIDTVKLKQRLSLARPLKAILHSKCMLSEDGFRVNEPKVYRNVCLKTLNKIQLE